MNYLRGIWDTITPRKKRKLPTPPPLDDPARPSTRPSPPTRSTTSPEHQGEEAALHQSPPPLITITAPPPSPPAETRARSSPSTMPLETLSIDHLPSTHRVHAALFRDVSNADFLHAQLLARNSAFDYAFIDATSVISRLHLLSAVYRALTTLADGTLTTTTPHAEIVLSFGVNNNVCPPLPLLPFPLSPLFSFPFPLDGRMLMVSGNRSQTRTDAGGYHQKQKT